MKIEGIHAISLPLPFPIKSINVYLIEGEGLTLIDTGVKTKKSLYLLKKGLKRLGFSLHDISNLIITHAHVDHCGLARHIKDISGCKVYINREEGSDLERGLGGSIIESGRYGIFFRKLGIPPALIGIMMAGNSFVERLRDPLKADIYLEDGSQIPLNREHLKIIHVPGHSPGLVCVYSDRHRVLFSSDHLLPTITPVALLHLSRNGERSKSLLKFLSSLKKIEGLGVNAILPGHGESFEDSRRLIEKYRLFHRKRALNIEKIIRKSGPISPYEISKKLFGSKARSQSFLTISEVVGHLDLLEEEERVKAVVKRDRIQYIVG